MGFNIARFEDAKECLHALVDKPWKLFEHYIVTQRWKPEFYTTSKKIEHSLASSNEEINWVPEFATTMPPVDNTLGDPSKTILEEDHYGPWMLVSNRSKSLRASKNKKGDKRQRQWWKGKQSANKFDVLQESQEAVTEDTSQPPSGNSNRGLKETHHIEHEISANKNFNLIPASNAFSLTGVGS